MLVRNCVHQAAIRHLLNTASMGTQERYVANCSTAHPPRSRPKISSELWFSRTAGRTVLTLPEFMSNHSNHRGIDATHVVVVGVVAAKSDARRSRNDRVYSVWSLSDLESLSPTGGVVKLFLFGNCHERLWKEPEGSVVALLGPRLLGFSPVSRRSTFAHH